MSTQIIRNPTPLPPPKYIALVGFIGFAATLFLLFAAFEAEREIQNLGEELNKKREMM